jgi:UDP-GlcNAc:undecaprenyl-phosphate GlcNAc-1-phosphate transferase
VNFPFNFFLAAFAGAFFASLLALPFWRKWCWRANLVDAPGHRKIHDKPIPLAGGFSVLTGILLPLIVGAIAIKSGAVRISLSNLIAHGLERRGHELVVIAIGAIAITLLGWLDDKHEMKPLPKFVGQFLIALLVAFGGLRITLFVHNEIFSYAITILWLLAVINAFNFMDNMNGLCGGLGAIGAFYFGLVAVTAPVPQYLVALIAFLVFGAVVGFLPHNFPRAKSFLGDSGSHLIGYLLAVLAILPHFYTRQNRHAVAVLTPLLILAVPLGDLVWVVIIRSRMGKPFYVGDNNHLSHRLVRLGMSRTRAVLAIWALAVAFGAIAFA